MAGMLFVVAVPIGNLSDITFRAVETLRNVDLIAAEDTRTTGVLLEKYGIQTKAISYHKFSEKEKAPFFIEKLLSGENIALVSDAGTPLISDPGCILVKSAIENGIKIVPVGGISALTTFLSSIYREGESFKFIGFLPKVKPQIEEIFIQNEFENLVFYESPNRIKDTFEIIRALRPSAFLSIGRELTKKFEEIKTGDIKSLIEFYEKNPIKGEIVCLLHKNSDELKFDVELEQKVKALRNAGFSVKDTSVILNITDNAKKNKVKEYFLKND